MSIKIGPYYTLPNIMERVGKPNHASFKDILTSANELYAIKNFILKHPQVTGISLPQIGIKYNCAVSRALYSSEKIQIWANAKYIPLEGDVWETEEDCFCAGYPRRFRRSDNIRISFDCYSFANQKIESKCDTYDLKLNFAKSSQSSREALFLVQHLIDHMNGDISKGTIINEREPLDRKKDEQENA